MTAPDAGAVVSWWEDDALRCGVVVGEEKQRLTVVAADGRESRLPPARVVAVLERGDAVGRDPEARRAASDRARQAEARLAARVREVDVATLWELVGREEERVHTETELAAIAFERPTERERAAIVVALRSDGVHFARKTAGWVARSAEHVQGILAGRAAESRRAEERAAVHTALTGAARGVGFTTTGTETERTVLAALERLAVFDLEATERERALALAALDAAKVGGERPAERAFRLLRAVGRFPSEHENLSIVRYGLRTAFPEGVEAAAEIAAGRGFDRSGREDLTGRASVTIDAAWTSEVDDALTVAPAGAGCTEVGIHIADPGAFVVPGDPVDSEALLRGTTYYFPEGKLLMLPSVLAEGAASLASGETRPALSFLVTIDAEGRIAHAEILRSVVRVASRLDYEAVDRTLASGEGPHAESLEALDRVAAARERVRLAAGAIALRAPEAEARIGAGGELEVTRRDQGTPAQRLVSEMMVLAGEVAASWLIARGAPAIFRRQPPPEGSVPEVDPALPDAVRVRAIRRVLRRGETSLAPGVHHGLGLAAYAQVTSPLRRFQDLSLHRQIASMLTRGMPAYDAAAMQSILAATERAESDGRRAERAAQRYAMLRILERAAGATVTGVVVEVVPRPVVTLDETLLDEPVPALVGAALGDRVRLRVERVNPRADVLVLRPS